MPCSWGPGGTTALEGSGDGDAEPHSTGSSWHQGQVLLEGLGSTKPGQQWWRIPGGSKPCWQGTVAGGTPSPSCTGAPARPS